MPEQTLTPFLEHNMENLPNETHGRADCPPNRPQTWQQSCAPFRQKNAASFLRGETPGVMATYAPETYTCNCQETDETVMELVEWREQAPYG